MILKEENIEIIVEELKSQGKSSVEIFRELQAQISEIVLVKPYSSIESNYTSLFIYKMIKDKVPLNEFNGLMRIIFDDLNQQQIENTFSRFFIERDADITLKKFLESEKFNNEYSSWDNMSYLFLDIKGNKLVFDHVDYLNCIFKNVPSDKIEGMYMGKMHFFIENVLVSNTDELDKIFQTIKKNKAFEVQKEKYHSNFAGNLIHMLLRCSYEMSPEKTQEMHYKFSKTIEDFNEKILDFYLPKEGRGKGDVFRISNLIGFDKVICRVQENYKTNLHSLSSYKLGDEISNLKIDFKIYLSDVSWSYNFDFDTNKSLVDNAVQFALLITAVSNNKDISLKSKDVDYLCKEIDLIKDEDYDHPLCFLAREKEISVFLQKEKLSKTIAPASEKPSAKNKI